MTLWVFWTELIELNKTTSASVDSVAARPLWLSHYITDRCGFWLHKLSFWLRLCFGVKALHPAEFFFKFKTPSRLFQLLADWGRCYERANAVVKHVGRGRLKRLGPRAKKSKWQPCCYSSFQCDVILALRSMFVLSLRDSATSKSPLCFWKNWRRFRGQKIWGPPAFIFLLSG